MSLNLGVGVGESNRKKVRHNRGLVVAGGALGRVSASLPRQPLNAHNAAFDPVRRESWQGRLEICPSAKPLESRLGHLEAIDNRYEDDDVLTKGYFLLLCRSLGFLADS
jgi:hypothetical protein